jgi:hypothetical protein
VKALQPISADKTVAVRDFATVARLTMLLLRKSHVACIDGALRWWGMCFVIRANEHGNFGCFMDQMIEWHAFGILVAIAVMRHCYLRMATNIATSASVSAPQYQTNDRPRSQINSSFSLPKIINKLFIRQRLPFSDVYEAALGYERTGYFRHIRACTFPHIIEYVQRWTNQTSSFLKTTIWLDAVAHSIRFPGWLPVYQS